MSELRFFLAKWGVVVPGKAVREPTSRQPRRERKLLLVLFIIVIGRHRRFCQNLVDDAVCFGFFRTKEKISISVFGDLLQRLARVSQRTAFFHLGNLVEYGETATIFTNPSDPRTESYITGRIG